MSWPEMLGVLGSISIILASATAVYGIKSWRREMIGRRRFDLAEEVLALFYEARDKVRAIRSPIGFQGEGATRKRRDDETDEESRLLDVAFMTMERYQKYEQTFNRLRALRYRAMVLFGKDRGDPFEELDKIVNKVLIAASMGADIQLRLLKYRDESRQARDLGKSLQKQQDVFWWGGDDDPIQESVDAAVEQLEAICRDVLSVKE